MKDKKSLYILLATLAVLSLILAACGGTSGPTFASFKLSEKTRQTRTVVTFDIETALANRFWISIPAPEKGTSNWTIHNPEGCTASKIDSTGYTITSETVNIADGTEINSALRLSVECPKPNSDFWLSALKTK